LANVDDAVRKADIGQLRRGSMRLGCAVRDIRQLGDIQACQAGHGGSETLLRSEIRRRRPDVDVDGRAEGDECSMAKEDLGGGEASEPQDTCWRRFDGLTLARNGR